MHVVYLREVYIHPDEPWFSSTLCVRVTCKVHKSVRRNDNYTREPCHPFYRGEIYLQEIILWAFHPCQEIFGRDGQKLDPIQLQTPLGLLDEAHQTLKLWKGSNLKEVWLFETTISSMTVADLLWNGTSLWSLLLNTSGNWSLNSSACSISEAVIPVPPLLLRGGILWLSFFLTVYVPIEVLRICLNVADKCSLTSSLISLLKVSNFDVSFLLPVFFALAWVLFLLRIFLLISEVIHGTEETVRLVLDGMFSSTESSSLVPSEYLDNRWNTFPLQIQMHLSS